MRLSTSRWNGGLDSLAVHIGEVSGRQRYVPEYVATGLSRVGDRTSWQVIPTGFEMPLEDVDVALEMPGQVSVVTCATGNLDPCTTVRLSDQTITIHQSHLDRGESLSIDGAVNEGTFATDQTRLATCPRLGQRCAPACSTSSGSSSSCYSEQPCCVIVVGQDSGSRTDRLRPSMPPAVQPALTRERWPSCVAALPMCWPTRLPSCRPSSTDWSQPPM